MNSQNFIGKFYNYFSTHYLGLIKSDFQHLSQIKTRSKVSFLICGAQKSGTTALDSYLRKHPEICMAVFKEVHFFDREKFFLYPHVNYKKYLSFFEPEKSSQILGETTPSYMYWYTAPRRIWEYNPEMKLIIILRNPIERAYSHWNMQRDRGVETLSFQDAIKIEEDRRRKSLPYQNKRFSYVDRGFYTEQIKRVRTYFRPKQILILRNQELRHSPLGVLNKISEFLDISQFPVIKPKEFHSRDYRDQISSSEWDCLKNIYLWDIKELEELTSWDCNDWLGRG